jgi:hypothetical protein
VVCLTAQEVSELRAKLEAATGDSKGLLKERDDKIMALVKELDEATLLYTESKAELDQSAFQCDKRWLWAFDVTGPRYMCSLTASLIKVSHPVIELQSSLTCKTGLVPRAGLW